MLWGLRHGGDASARGLDVPDGNDGLAVLGGLEDLEDPLWDDVVLSEEFTDQTSQLYWREILEHDTFQQVLCSHESPPNERAPR